MAAWPASACDPGDLQCNTNVRGSTVKFPQACPELSQILAPEPTVEPSGPAAALASRITRAGLARAGDQQQPINVTKRHLGLAVSTRHQPAGVSAQGEPILLPVPTLQARSRRSLDRLL